MSNVFQGLLYIYIYIYIYIVRFKELVIFVTALCLHKRIFTQLKVIYKMETIVLSGHITSGSMNKN